MRAVLAGLRRRLRAAVARREVPSIPAPIIAPPREERRPWIERRPWQASRNFTANLMSKTFKLSKPIVTHGGNGPNPETREVTLREAGRR